MRTAVFPGSFDPFTYGHASVVRQGLALFDRVVIAVGVNAHKKSMFSLEQRLSQIQALYADEPRVEVRACRGLTVDFAQECGAGFLLRSIRNVADFEYEREMAMVNSQLAASHCPGLQTVVLFADPRYEAVQSSVVRELMSYGEDVSEYVPQAVRDCF